MILMLEVGKTYKHANSSDKNNVFTIVDRCTNYFIGESVLGKRWLFDENGNAVGCFGSNVSPKFSIREMPTEEVIYVRLNRLGDTSVSDKPFHGTSVVSIKLTFVDGIAVDVELDKTNDDKFEAERVIIQAR
jgi:hypothetical protein